MELHLYEEKHDLMCKEYQLLREQLKYAHHPSTAIAITNEDLSRHGILAIENGCLVTFFVVHEGDGPKQYSKNERALLIRSFSTDVRFQGRGCGVRALALLPDFVRRTFPHVDEIVLAVNVANLNARKLYAKAGFSDTKRRRRGTNGMLIIMNQKVR